MARAPFQVLVFPYRRANDSEIEYTLLKRVDAEFWQAVAGGGEDDETPLDAARRETLEETGISTDSFFLQLQTVLFVPVNEFRDSHLWGNSLYVIPQYCFGVLVKDKLIALSREHTEYRWLKYAEAQTLMKFNADRVALWELDRRARGLGPRD